MRTKAKQPRQMDIFDMTGELPPMKGGTIHDDTAIGGLFAHDWKGLLPDRELAKVVREIAKQDIPPSERLALIDWLCAEYGETKQTA